MKNSEYVTLKKSIETELAVYQGKIIGLAISLIAISLLALFVRTSSHNEVVHIIIIVVLIIVLICAFIVSFSILRTPDAFLDKFKRLKQFWHMGIEYEEAIKQLDMLPEKE